MRSLAYMLAKPLINAVGHKYVYAMDESALRSFLEEEAGNQDQLPPKWFRDRYSIVTKESMGSPIFVIKPKHGCCCWKRNTNKSAETSATASAATSASTTASAATPASTATATPAPISTPTPAPIILFLHGGGFIFEAQIAHWIALDKIIRRTGATVWFCVYPLLPSNTIYESSDVVFETYLQMLEIYGEGQITVIGDSAGAILSLNLAHWLSKPEINLPQPKKIILVSPAQTIVQDQERRAQMDAINPKDIMLNTSLLDVMAKLMPVCQGYDDFYQFPLEGDFFKFPPLVVFTGTYEVFYPLMAGFLLRMRGSGVPVAYYQGDGLCHCWPYVPFVPECERGLSQLIRTID